MNLRRLLEKLIRKYKLWHISGAEAFYFISFRAQSSDYPVSGAICSHTVASCCFFIARQHQGLVPVERLWQVALRCWRHCYYDCHSWPSSQMLYCVACCCLMSSSCCCCTSSCHSLTAATSPSPTAAATATSTATKVCANMTEDDVVWWWGGDASFLFFSPFFSFLQRWGKNRSNMVYAV